MRFIFGFKENWQSQGVSGCIRSRFLHTQLNGAAKAFVTASLQKVTFADGVTTPK
ncbi:MAG: hypothetical protein AB8G05_07505 [Oligoflexales bacterium]